MYIQWFPGHMTKAMRMLEQSVGISDCIIYVLDARAVASSFNPKFDALIGSRPVLYVLNKCDMVEPAQLKEWERRLASEGKSAVSMDSTSGKFRSICISRLLDINSRVLDKYKSKGVNKCIRAMVVGVPNTGKSTLINCLSGSKRAATGNKAGVTRGKQWISLSAGIDLLDTPGTLPPAFEDNVKAVHLAMIGSVKEEVLDISELALETIAFFRQNADIRFTGRYKIDGFCDSDLATLEAIAVKRGFILGKDNIDYERASRAIIDDLRKLRIGKVMLDKA